MTFRISVDTGGTFTDAIICDSEKILSIGKGLTNTVNAFEGVSAAITAAGKPLELSLTQILKETEIFIYGTTRATNAIVTGNTAKTAFLTTKGFPDLLVLKEGGKQKAHDFSVKYPRPYIPKKNTFEIDERINSEGGISKPLDLKKTRALIKKLKQDKFEAIAVSLVWSIMNPCHEIEVGKIIKEIAPQIPFSLGHDLIPVLREYRRASTTCIDSSLKPLMQKHFIELRDKLQQNQFSGQLFISTSAGSWAQVERIIDNPIHTTKSGPAMAPVAAKSFGNLEGGGKNFIVCDTGGTTFDVGLVHNNELKYSRTTWVGGEWIGNLSSISSVDISSIGSGGGSIAWIDAGGLLRLGPDSAGSNPGPACYGNGGTQPTFSDAACVLGYLNPKFFLGGRMKLDIKAARDALSSVAKKLNKSIEETSFGILQLGSEIMTNAVRNTTISKGIDPRESTIVAGGGAAGLNILLIAKELGVSKVILPQYASALSASGMQFADIVKDISTNIFTTSEELDIKKIKAELNALKLELKGFQKTLPKEQRKAAFEITFSTEARYSSQIWEIDVAIDSKMISSKNFKDNLIEAFHKTHEQLFTLRDEGSNIEFLNWKAKLSVKSGIILKNKKLKANKTDKRMKKEYRDCFFGDAKPIKTSVYRSVDIIPKKLIKGPCVIEDENTTVIVFPGMSAQMSDNKNFILNFK